MTPEQLALQFLSLQGKVAIVTGAASGIGRDIALLFSRMGASVAVLDVNEHGASETVNQITAQTGCALAMKCDVRSARDCNQAIQAIVSHFKKIDILCNNAGIAIRKDSVQLSEDEWDLALDVNLKSVYLMSHQVIPHMAVNGGGVIINTASGWSLKGGPKAASYCASKGGVLNLTRAMAIDHGPQNIRVNCVCPGDVDTPMLHSECTQIGADPGTFMKEAAARPLARVGTPEDVAKAVLFLASDMAKWITGAALVVDGGGLA